MYQGLSRLRASLSINKASPVKFRRGMEVTLCAAFFICSVRFSQLKAVPNVVGFELRSCSVKSAFCDLGHKTSLVIKLLFEVVKTHTPTQMCVFWVCLF